MSITEHLLQLVQHIYDVPLGRQDWTSVIGAITHASGGHSGLMRLVDYRQGAVGIVATHGYDEHQLEIYQKHFVNLDPYRDRLLSAAAGTLLQSDQAAPLATRRHTEYFNDYERPADRIHALGIPLGREKDYVLYLGLSRGRAAGPYEQETLEFLQHLLPHLLRAVQIQRLIGSAIEARQLCESAINNLRCGVVFLNSAGAVRFANTAAIEIATKFGIRIGESGLSLPESRVNSRLQHLIFAASLSTEPGQLGAGGDFTYAKVGTGFLQIRVFPFLPSSEPALFGKSVNIAVFLICPGPPQLNTRQLSQQFGLTPAESRLATYLIRGETVTDAAKIAGTSIATARTQLRAIFAKTGTSRQAELALLLLTSLAGITRDTTLPRSTNHE